MRARSAECAGEGQRRARERKGEGRDEGDEEGREICDSCPKFYIDISM